MVMLRQKLTLEVGVIRKHVASRACTLGLQRQNWLVKREDASSPWSERGFMIQFDEETRIFFKGAGEKFPPTRKTIAWQFVVPFLGWLSDPLEWLGDLQLGDEKVTLNHLVDDHFTKGWWCRRVVTHGQWSKYDASQLLFSLIFL